MCSKSIEAEAVFSKQKQTMNETLIFFKIVSLTFNVLVVTLLGTRNKDTRQEMS